MPDPGGELGIAIHRSSGEVRIGSSRPLAATQVFVGKPVDLVARRLPLLYSVCATAQAVACVQASERLLGICPPASVSIQRALLMLAETAKEHLWRLLLDWPRALAPLAAAPPADEIALGTALRAYLTLRRRLSAAGDPLRPGARSPLPAVDSIEPPIAALIETAQQRVFGTQASAWLRQTTDADALLRWAAQGETGPAHLVRVIRRDELAELGRNPVAMLDPSADAGQSATIRDALAATDADAFVAHPTIHGQPRETTPLAREMARQGAVAELAARHGNGLLPRLGALLVELARALAALQTAASGAADSLSPTRSAIAAAPTDQAGAAIGVADAARGLLVHRLAGTRERVVGYRILAPTEWNFHPRGVVAQGLAAIAGDLPSRSADALLRHRAALYVTAVDPCVAYRLEIGGAG